MRVLKVLAVAMVVGTTAMPAQERPAGAAGVPLFDGTTLSGWNRVGDANWSVADGAIQATTGAGYVVTPRSYGDFQLTFLGGTSNAPGVVDANLEIGTFLAVNTSNSTTTLNVSGPAASRV